MKWWLENVYEPIKPKISEFFTTIALIEKSLGIEIYKPFSEP